MKTLINIDVPELQPAIDFYCDAFTLKLNRLLDDDVAELAGASSIIYLLKKQRCSQWSSKVSADRDYRRHWTPVHVDFVVEDIESATQRVLNAGALRESNRVDWRGSKCVTFSDPFGHGFCLIEFIDTTYTDDDTKKTKA